MSRFIVLLFVISFLAPSYSYSQQEGAYYDGRKKYWIHTERLSLSASPLSLLDTYNGSAYKAGISVRPFLWMRVTADAGGYIPSMTSSLAGFQSMKGYHFRGSIGVIDNYNDFGAGISYQFKKQSFFYDATVLPSETNYTAFVSKFAHSYNVYANYNLFVSPLFYVELRLDLGARYREITNSHSHLVDASEEWGDSWFSGRITNTQSFVPNFAASVRLNWTLWETSSYE